MTCFNKMLKLTIASRIACGVLLCVACGVSNSRSGCAAQAIAVEKVAATRGIQVQFTPAQGVLIEAEAVPQGEVAVDAQASGGRYTHRDGDYQPVFRADLPAGAVGIPAADAATTEYTIWVRSRGVSLQLKGVDTSSRQSDLKWIYERPTRWKWNSFGRFSRSQLGVALLMIRAPRGDATEDVDKNSGVDAVVLATDKDFDPSRDFQMFAEPLRINVDWNKKLFTTGPLSFGLNAFAAFNPKQTQGAYNTQVAYTGAGFLRLHNWGMMNDSSSGDGWIDIANKQWDAAKIKRALDGLYPDKPVLLLNIPAWPAWMDTNKDGFLDADCKEAYAAFCADLVRIVNVQLKHRVAYWEITNERDGLYYGDFQKSNGLGGLKDASKPDRLDELADIFNRCARAMKKVDPTIQTGGPALARSDWTDFTRRFVRLTLPNLDFYSYHVYVSGSRDDSDDAIYDRAQGIGGATRAITDILKAESPKRHIPAFLNEYNISWSWEVRDPRMTNNKGAVFDALALIAALSNGADATNAWNEKDGIYGKIAPDNSLRPGAHLFHLFNEYLRGQVVSSSSSDDKSVVIFAVWNAAKKQRSLLIVNRSDIYQRAVSVIKPLFTENPGFLGDYFLGSYQITEKGFSHSPLISLLKANGRTETQLVPHSVMLLTASESATQK